MLHLKRYSPACTRLLSQYKTMLKLVGADVPSVDDFMKRYRVSVQPDVVLIVSLWPFSDRWITQQLYTE